MIRTQCNNCGAIERTHASIHSKCMFCGKGIMIRIDDLND